MHAERRDYHYDKSKLLRNFLICLGFVGIAAWFAIAPNRTGDFRHMLLWPCAVIFACVGLALLRKLFTSAPALILSPAGFLFPSFSPDMIPWLAVQELQRVQNKRIEYISVRIDPAVARSLSKQGVRRFLPAFVLGNQTKLVIPSKVMQGDPAMIFSRCAEALAKARDAERVTLTAGDLPLPTHSEPVEPPALKRGQPYFTYGLIALLAAIYWGELTFGVDPPQAGTPSIQTLFILGGTFRQSIVEQGQWWRLFTAPLMHGSVAHLLLNCFSLWLAGALLERLIGWRWFAGIFFVSALGGSIASIFLNAPNIVGVGASGGIVGLFAAAIAASFHFQSARISTIMKVRAAQILLPSLLPFLSNARNGEHIDYSAHLGGAVAGGLLTLGMLALWPRQRALPRFNKSMAAVSIVFLAVATVSLLPIMILRQAVVDRPLADYAAGHFERAAKGFALKAQAGDENVAYFYLWQFLSETHLNYADALAALRANAAKVDHARWPYPVFDVFLDASKPEDIAAKAADADQRCEASFYQGEWYRLRNDNPNAVSRFQAALSSCPQTFMEFDGATAELAQLKGK